MEQEHVTSIIIEHIGKAENFKLEDVQCHKWVTFLRKYENYMSEIKRLEITLKGLSPTVRTYIVKRTTDEQIEPIRCLPLEECFNTEIFVYVDVLNQIKNLITYNHLDISIMWPKLITHFDNETIVLEDLKRSGYTMSNMNAAHNMLAIKSLGQLHGLSAVLIQRGELTFPIRDPPCSRKLHYFNVHFTNGLKGLVSYLDRRCNPKWANAKRKLEKLIPTFLDDLQELSHKTQGKYNVFNHGDCWKNNLLFQHNSDDAPVSVKFLDYQMSFINSFSWDLVLFLFINLSRQTRYGMMDEFLTTYQQSFAETVSKLGPEFVAPSKGDVKEGLDSLLLYGLFLACGSRVDINDGEDFLSDNEIMNREGWFVERHELLMMDLEYFSKKGFFLN